MTDGEEALFVDDTPQPAAAGGGPRSWRILVVDDDLDIHEATELALQDLQILDRPFELLHAHSAAAGLELLQRERDIAVVLLDVVMETPTAGLDMIAAIRERLGLRNTRIILRTGQPGYAPEVETVRRFDINAYHTKSELTRSRLYVALSTAVRAYEQLERVATLNERLHRQAYRDALVGLPNRNALIEAIDSRIAGEGGQGQVLALLDLDQFAEINDMFGHRYADRLLQEIARRLDAAFGGDALIARTGADTFGLLGRAESLEPAALREVLAVPFAIDGSEHVVSAAVGLVRLGEGRGRGEDRLKDASIALKRAKSGGHGQTAWYTPEIAFETRERTRLLHALREAFNYERMFVVYQPQVALATGGVVGFEALVRWRTEEGRFVPPDTFIPVAENSGLIVSLGNWVLRTALRAAITLRQAAGVPCRMAVNVSAVQFRHPDFLATLDDAMAETGTSPQDLELEITESVAMMGSDIVAAAFSALKARGVALAIDDFGTGFSSLSYLDRLPADRLKIDRSFVAALDSGQRGERIAELVIPLGRQLGMRVLAEGIETPQQVERLRALGCDEGQGYHFARPLPLPDALEWLRARQEVQP